jgi:hypothetical protein
VVNVETESSAKNFAESSAKEKKPVGQKLFRVTVLASKTGVCSWKRHARGCMAQLLGYLESMAALDSERFVWPKVETIITMCRTFDDKKKYARSMVFRCLAEAKRLGILCRDNRFRRGKNRLGFVMAAHDSMHRQDRGLCIFDSQPSAVVAINRDQEVDSEIPKVDFLISESGRTSTRKVDFVWPKVD